MKEKIKRCPFCGGGSLRVASILGEWHVICIHCRARGPDRKNKEGAMVAWNCRTAIPEEVRNEDATDYSNAR